MSNEVCEEKFHVSKIKNVWVDNFMEEFVKMISLIDDYPFVAMDTEFPGLVARPQCESGLNAYQMTFQLLRCNVDLLKLIQLGITLMDKNGNIPDETSTWQFNFEFDLSKDMHAYDSIQMLKEAGIDFERHSKEGIDHQVFAECFMMSGLVLNNKVTWISFHSNYDYGYLMKILLNTDIPDDIKVFLEKMDILFPRHYDVKQLMSKCETLKGGLQDIASTLNIERIGIKHQAGSDSMITGRVFFRIRSKFYDNKLEKSQFENFLYGLGNTKGLDIEADIDKLGLNLF